METVGQNGMFHVEQGRAFGPENTAGFMPKCPYGMNKKLNKKKVDTLMRTSFHLTSFVRKNRPRKTGMEGFFESGWAYGIGKRKGPP